ncbi:HtaA domain-containing protein [Nocardioides sp. Arc9.136]|uniref:HtaA domain-containing protein n=1 Tax=Nocardioides sp. Arc9.136 TaxID=2996826 RepID=UPI002666F95F|nr:HtaA domain-containing protein [Nocardioides sp. Arc9.136]WKN47681.1 HtaA domain-containing protein [Nocardioides sp. Arc9.136]
MIRPTRWVASAAATTLAASGLALVAAAAPAPAAPPAPVLTWEISQQFDDHLSSHVLGGGATETTEGVVTFPDGVGTYDPATGAGSVSYAGSVAGSFAFGGSPFYTVTIANPTVTVDADGEGTVTAKVSASNVGSGQAPAASTDPERVTVTTFDAPAWTVADGLGSVTATPDWDGVLPEGPESVALGIKAGQPVAGRSWHPAFLGQLTPGVRAHFHASGASSDAKKAPAPFTAQATPAAAPVATPALEVTTTSASYADGLALSVTGTGFDPDAKVQRAPDGVYVGVAPSGGILGLTDAGFAAATHVGRAKLVSGSFTAALVVPTAKLDPARSWSVYTWSAHGNPVADDSQAVEKALAVDWSKLAQPDPGTDPGPGTGPEVPASNPRTTASVTAASYAGGVQVAVSGTGFRAVTNAGDNGVYVGLAPAGGMPSTGSQTDQAAFAAAAWVMPQQMPGGAFSTTLLAPTAKLDPTRSYAVYTWQAHTHSNTSQDTQTPVTIDWSRLAPPAGGPGGGSGPEQPEQPGEEPEQPGEEPEQPAAVGVTGPAQAAFGRSGSISAVITVGGEPASGTAVLTGLGAEQTSELVDGRATFRIPARLGAGRHTAWISFGGVVVAEHVVVVEKASPVVTARWSRQPTATAAGRLTTVVRGAAAVGDPAGRVRLRLYRDGKLRRTIAPVALEDGRATFAVARLGAGTWKVRVRYLGARNYVGDTTVLDLRVR